MQYELVSDCPWCRVQGAVLEVYDLADPACALGVAAEARCRLCDARWAGRVEPGPARGPRADGACPACGAVLGDAAVEAHACASCGARAVARCTREASVPRDRDALVRALERFARDEGADDLATFLRDGFDGLPVEALLAKLARGDAVETSFDSLFTLFQRGVRPGGARSPSPSPSPSPAPPPRPASHDPRAMLLALVSVLMADGHEHPRERAFVDRFLEAEGLAPLRGDELRVHRPVEVAPRIPPARRAEVVEMMVQLACIDGELDPSELRLVESYAAAWDLDDEEVARWIARYRARYAPDARRFLHRLRRFFLAPAPPDPRPEE